MGQGKPTDPELELSCVGQKWPGSHPGLAQLIASGCPENTVIGTKAEMDPVCYFVIYNKKYVFGLVSSPFWKSS